MKIHSSINISMYMFNTFFNCILSFFAVHRGKEVLLVFRRRISNLFHVSSMTFLFANSLALIHHLKTAILFTTFVISLPLTFTQACLRPPLPCINFTDLITCCVVCLHDWPHWLDPRKSDFAFK